MNQPTNRLAQAASCLSPPLYHLLSPHFARLEPTAQEIRLRVNRPVAIVCGAKTYYLTNSGSLSDLPCGELCLLEKEELEAVLQRLCDYSVYARQKEIADGYLTLRGGHRAGICGSAVVHGGEIVNIRDVSSVNIRVAHERRGCAREVFRLVQKRPGGVLLCGEPCAGKTTVLRDVARLLSTAGGAAVSLIDERGELAATACGVPQNDVGLCDVFDGYPKAEAMEQALRCMSPQIIICDEIGSPRDVASILRCQSSGVRLIATAHARSREELWQRRYLHRILSGGVFSTLVFLRGREHAGEIASVFEEVERLAA